MELVTLNSLFLIGNGSDLELNKMTQVEQGINFISRTSKNNGVAAIVAELTDKSPNPANSISVTLGGSVLEAFLQEKEYYTSYHVAVLTPLKVMTKQEMLFYCMCIRANKFRYNFGRQANKTLGSIKVPGFKEVPGYINQTPIKDLDYFSEALRNTDTPLLYIAEWKPFRLDELFIIKNGYYNKKPSHTKSGDTPFLGATAKDNGVTEYYSLEDIEQYHKDGTTNEDDFSKKLFDANCIAVTNNGSVGHGFYQEKAFTCSHDVTPLYLKNYELNKYIAMFLITIIQQEKFRYTYDRKWRAQKIPNTIINLPVDQEGNPDYQYMEDYIKTLPFTKEL